jgi:uncharacterized protein YndB with AHSA1/START domain
MAFQTSREIAAHPSSVFAAFKDSARLAVWWGPAGFTNTLKACEFKPGGKWSFVMHGPDGKDYPNESVFRDIEPSKRIVRWEQDFESPKVASAIERIVVPANEQNLDRLSAEVLRTHGG